MAVLKTKVQQTLKALRDLHSIGWLHGDLKPQNVLIDTFHKVKLAGYESNRRLNDGETTSSDVKDAGKLVYYILSSGHRQFEDGMDMVEDELAKDLIKQMTQDRTTVEEALNHPYFWNSKRKVDYLITLGKEKEATNFRKPNDELLEEMKKYMDETIHNWKSKVPSEVVQNLDSIQRQPYPETPLAFLRFIRNLYEHHPHAVNKNDLMMMFPGLLASFFKFAQANKWNERTSLKEFITEEVPEHSE